MKKIILVFYMFLVGCGYQSIYSNKNIGNLNHLGDFLLESNYINNNSTFNYLLRYNPNIERTAASARGVGDPLVVR